MIPLAAGQLGLCDATTESSRLEPVLHGKRNRLNEKLEHHNKEQPPHPTSPTTPPTQPQLMQLEKDFPDNSAGKESACNAGDTGLIPGSGRSPGEGIGYPLQDSGLENPMDCTVHGVAKSRTRLSDFHFRESLREGNGTPLQYSCLENSMDGGVW